MNKMIMFWARECPHCKHIMPIVEKLEMKTVELYQQLLIQKNIKSF